MVLCGLVFSTFSRGEATTVKVIREQEFQCRKLPGVSFQYPVFSEWEPKSTQEVENGCIIHLNWPPGISYETSRAIYVTKILLDNDKKLRFPPETGKEFTIGKIRCFAPSRNSHGIFFGKAFDPDIYTSGYIPPRGHWDYLQFYSQKFGVRIQIDGGNEEHGFSSDQFVKMAIDTFNVKD